MMMIKKRRADSIFRALLWSVLMAVVSVCGAAAAQPSGPKAVGVAAERGGACDRGRVCAPRRSAERERESLRARVEELDLEPAAGDGLRLPDQLI